MIEDYIVPDKPTPEELLNGFRDGLKDVVAIASVLSPHCGGSIENLVAVSKLALESDPQCQLLMSLTAIKKK